MPCSSNRRLIVAPVPTGTVDFYLFAPGNTGCSPLSATAHHETVTLADQLASTPDGFVSNAVGTWRWLAVYSGNAANAGGGSKRS